MERQRNKLGKFFNLDGSQGYTSVGSVGYDTNEMSATAVITTPAWDRTNDSLNPEGGSTEKYKSNPVVLWDHGKDISIPIAKCEDRNGNLSIVKSRDGWIGTSYFSSKCKQSEQIFDLITEGIIRATSVRFCPLEQPIIKSEGRLFNSWELEEWSWCPIGVNPEAIRCALSSNRLAGSQMDGSIRKSLMSAIPERPTKTFKIGWENMNQNTSGEKLGSLILQATHSQLHACSRNVKKAMSSLENPNTEGLLNEVLAAMQKLMGALEGGHQSEYKDDMPAYDDEATDPNKDKGYGMDKDEEEMMKSFLSKNPLQRYNVLSMSGKLDAISEAVDGHSASAIASIAKSWSDLVTEAGNMKQVSPAIDKLDGDISEVREAVSHLKSLMQEQVPFSRSK